MLRWIRPLAAAFTLLLTIGLAGGWWALKQTQHVPEFYARATGAETDRPQTERQSGTKSRQLPNDKLVVGTWNATFSTDEINDWLRKELPEKFPQLLAKGASEPRIEIENDRALAAVRYKNKRIDTIISCELAVELTEQPNMLALRVQHLKAGALPLPLSNFRKGISKEAAKGDIDIRWDDTESDPVALVTVPSEHPRYVSNTVIVESVSLVDGAMILSGNAGPLARATYKPLGPVYRFVSYRPGKKRKRQASLSTAKQRASGKLR